MSKNTSFSSRGVSPEFDSRFGQLTQGALFGLDRIRIRGTLRHLFAPNVMEAYLNASRVLIKDFASFTQSITQKVKKSAPEAENSDSRLIRLDGAVHPPNRVFNGLNN